MTYQRLNIVGGWLTFAIATAVYLSTIEPTASFWDCGEFIATAYKLEVGHPPGAPLFMLINRFFTMFAPVEQVAVFANAVSALCSSFTILFLFLFIKLELSCDATDYERMESCGERGRRTASIFVGGKVQL